MGTEFIDPTDQTICAQSTPHGRGGISIIRVSGKNALSIVKKICKFIPDVPESHRIYFGTLKNVQQEPIDEVLVSYFKEKQSYTAEETLEISCHGSPILVEHILSILISFGCRAAHRGEFTYRAFMNGRIDLTQSESVLSLIESQSRESAKQSIKQLQGSLSKNVTQIEADLVRVLAHIEASIDFSLENLETMSDDEITKNLKKAESRLEKLVTSYTQGKKIKDGIDVVLSGLPNVGKSSLINQLYGDQKALVSERPGTTRDLIEASIYIKGRLFNFIDTAGLRATDDQVEKMGVDLSLKRRNSADLVLFIMDANQATSEAEISIINSLDPSKTVLILNKRDLIQKHNEQATEELLASLKETEFYNKISNIEHFKSNKISIISTLYEKDKEKLFNLIFDLTNDFSQSEDALIMHERQFEGLNLSLNSLKQTIQNNVNSMSSEIIALDLRESILKLQEVIGTRYDEQVLDRLFKEFCLGK
jgi:tRNA modification GTPase